MIRFYGYPGKNEFENIFQKFPNPKLCHESASKIHYNAAYFLSQLKYSCQVDLGQVNTFGAIFCGLEVS